MYHAFLVILLLVPLMTVECSSSQSNENNPSLSRVIDPSGESDRVMYKNHNVARKEASPLTGERRKEALKNAQKAFGSSTKKERRDPRGRLASKP